MIKAIIFDFDGVIADSHEHIISILKNINIYTNNDDFLAHHDGNVFEQPKLAFTDENGPLFDKQYLDGIHTVQSFFTR